MSARMRALMLRHPYLPFGLAFALVALVLPMTRWQDPEFFDDFRFAWKVVTGGLLTILMGYQWALLIARLSGAPARIQKHYQLHRWLGVGSLVLFGAHLGGFGHLWTSVLAAIYLGCAMTGMMNREVMRYRAQRWYQLWFFAHFVLAIALVPLVATHIFVALAY